MKTQLYKFGIGTWVWICLLACTFSGCSDNTPRDQTGTSTRTTKETMIVRYPPKLSDYGMFASPMSDLQPSEGTFEYQLNTPLFSDYSLKQRLIKLPKGRKAKIEADGSIRFPVGTVIAKTFYYREDFSVKDSPKQIIETRILEHREEGWIAIPYLWNPNKTDAELAIAGATVPVTWNQRNGESETISYIVPNLNDCSRCHLNEVIKPIGPKVTNLNRPMDLHSPSTNQLVDWQHKAILDGDWDISTLPKMAVWDDPQYPLDHRARAYLDVNCGHCHNEKGPARNSGLHLTYDTQDPYRLGVFKNPVAAGKGTGGRTYGIVPGKPEESIMAYRMKTLKPDEIMPEYGKSLFHPEGYQLIFDWIRQMPPVESTD